MTGTTVSSRAFNQNASGAKRAGSKGPVILTDRAPPAPVLPAIEACQKLTQKTANRADLLAMPDLQGGDRAGARQSGAAAGNSSNPKCRWQGTLAGL